jgi:hypothetical protein
MLTSVLPGLRELRTPLAAGGVWLLTLWLVFGEQLRGSAEQQPFLKNLTALSEYAGKPLVSAAISLAAYLVGTVLTVNAAAAERWTQLLKLRGLSAARTARVQPSEATDLQLKYLLLRKMPLFAEEFVPPPGPGGGGGSVLSDEGRELYWTKIEPAKTALNPKYGMIETEAYLAAFRLDVLGEVYQLALRLLAEYKDLYQEYDRIAAEGEFRLSVSPPLFALGIVSALEWNYLIGAAIAVAAIIIWIKGRTKSVISVNTLIQAITAEKITAQVLDRLESAAKLKAERESGVSPQTQ